MKVDISKITKKFYKDSERWLKAAATQELMMELYGQIGGLFQELHMKGYKFHIFHMDKEAATLHASLVYCCGKWANHAVDPRLRQEVIDPIIHENTRYKRILWEDLIQIGKMY